jgi:hypothetical protein
MMASEHVHLRMSTELLKAIDRRCELIGMSRSEFIRRGCRLHLRLAPERDITFSTDMTPEDWDIIKRRLDAAKEQGE